MRTSKLFLNLILIATLLLITTCAKKVDQDPVNGTQRKNTNGEETTIINSPEDQSNSNSSNNDSNQTNTPPKNDVPVISPPANIAPNVSAGQDKEVLQSITVVTFSGIASDSDGTISSVQWKIIDGPTATLTQADKNLVSISNLQEGIYTLSFTATDDKGDSSTDLVKLTVLKKNIPPSVFAGEDKIITLPQASYTLSGIASDIDGSIINVEWKQISGPSVILRNATTNNLNLTEIKEGSYVFSFLAKDNSGATIKDSVNLTVKAQNLKPIVSAGTAQELTLPINAISLKGSATDSDGTIKSVLWQKLSGPNVSLSNTTSNTLVLSNMQAGTYTFSFTAFDNLNDSSTATVSIIVHPKNILPIVTANQDFEVELPLAIIKLNGTATDTDGTIKSLKWEKISGPNITLSNSTTLECSLSNLVAGDYQFKFTATDDKNESSSKIVNLKVLSINKVPEISQISDIEIQLPTNSASITAVVSDSDGSVTLKEWKKISGPNASLSNINSNTLTLNNLLEGSYTFSFSASDDRGGSASQTVNLTVLAKNQIPLVTTSADITIQLPSSAITLSASASDNDGSIQSVLWEKLSGSSVTMGNATTNNLNLSNLTAGIYNFKFTATDNNNESASNSIKVTVLAANIPPQITTIPDSEITLPMTSYSITANASDSDGSISSVLWKQISGSTLNVINTSTNTITISNLNSGIYSFSFTATDDKGASTTIITKLTIKDAPAPNVAPSVSAGPDKEITLPINSITLNATASDSDGTIASVEWVKQSGPDYKMTGDKSNSLSITDLTEGTYTLFFSATDNEGLISSDSMILTVKPAQASNTTISKLSFTGIKGTKDVTTMTDPTLLLDEQTLAGDPLNGSGGDALTSFGATAGSATTSGHVDLNGTYTVKHFCYYDKNGTGSYTFQHGTPGNWIEIVTDPMDKYKLWKCIDTNFATKYIRAINSTGYIVVPEIVLYGYAGVSNGTEPPANSAPQVSLENNKSITLPLNNTTLNATATDSDGSIASVAWTKVSGPTATLANATTNTLALSNLVEGSYSFEFKATDDKGASSSAIFSLTVNPEVVVDPNNLSPIVNAGPDRTIIIMNDTISISAATVRDDDGTISSMKWEKISGPNITLENTNLQGFMAKNLIPGIYEFKFTATDDKGASTSDTVIITLDPTPVFSSTPPVYEKLIPVNGRILKPTTVNHYIHLPSGYNPADNKKYPLLFFFHGLGEKGNASVQVDGVWTINESILSKVLRHGPPLLIKNSQWINDEFIVVAPQSTGGGFSGSTIRPLYDYIVNSYKVDTNRFYTTGLSQGGNSTYNSLRDLPELISAAIPIAAWAPTLDCEQIKHIAVWAFHGDKDTTVGYSSGKSAYTKVKNCGTNFYPKFTSYAGVTHNSWTRTYNFSMASAYNHEDANDDATKNIGGDAVVYHDIYKWLLSFSLKPEVIVPNIAPVASVGSDKEITLPTNTTTLTGSGADSDGTISSVLWKQTNGPAITLTNAATNTVTLSNLIEGIYTFSFTVTDDDAATNSNSLNLVVNAQPASETTPEETLVYQDEPLDLVLPNELDHFGNTEVSEGRKNELNDLVTNSPVQPFEGRPRLYGSNSQFEAKYAKFDILDPNCLFEGQKGIGVTVNIKNEYDILMYGGETCLNKDQTSLFHHKDAKFYLVENTDTYDVYRSHKVIFLIRRLMYCHEMQNSNCAYSENELNALIESFITYEIDYLKNAPKNEFGFYKHFHKGYNGSFFDLGAVNPFMLWSLVLDQFWNHSALSQEDKDFVIAALDVEVDNYIESYNSKHWNIWNGNNWTMAVNSAILHYSILFYYERPARAKQLLDIVLETNWLHRDHYLLDGTYNEGASYVASDFNNSMKMNTLFMTAFDQPAHFLKWGVISERTAQWVLNSVSSADSRYFDFGDAWDRHGIAGSQPLEMKLMAEESGIIPKGSTEFDPCFVKEFMGKNYFGGFANQPHLLMEGMARDWGSVAAQCQATTSAEVPRLYIQELYGEAILKNFMPGATSLAESASSTDLGKINSDSTELGITGVPLEYPHREADFGAVIWSAYGSRLLSDFGYGELPAGGLLYSVGDTKGYFKYEEDADRVEFYVKDLNGPKPADFNKVNFGIQVQWTTADLPIGDYITPETSNGWTKVSIPLKDFNISTAAWNYVSANPAFSQAGVKYVYFKVTGTDKDSNLGFDEVQFVSSANPSSDILWYGDTHNDSFQGHAIVKPYTDAMIYTEESGTGALGSTSFIKIIPGTSGPSVGMYYTSSLQDKNVRKQFDYTAIGANALVFPNAKIGAKYLAQDKNSSGTVRKIAVADSEVVHLNGSKALGSTLPDGMVDYYHRYTLGIEKGNYLVIDTFKMKPGKETTPQEFFFAMNKEEKTDCNKYEASNVTVEQLNNKAIKLDADCNMISKSTSFQGEAEGYIVSESLEPGKMVYGIPEFLTSDSMFFNKAVDGDSLYLTNRLGNLEKRRLFYYTSDNVISEDVRIFLLQANTQRLGHQMGTVTKVSCGAGKVCFRVKVDSFTDKIITVTKENGQYKLTGIE